ncbi:unnamed protein product [Closterium sp. NIES-54]
MAALLTKFVENVGRWRPNKEPEGTAGQGRTVEARATTGPLVWSASETGTGAARGVCEVQSRKKQRDAPESSVKVCKASAEEGPVCLLLALLVLVPRPLFPSLTFVLPCFVLITTARTILLSRVLASLVTDPRASLSSVSTLTAAITEFASTRCLDYATSLVAAPPTSPLAIGAYTRLHRPSAFTGTFPPGTKWRLRRPVYSLHQAPHEWHDTLRSTFSDLGFQPSSADSSMFVRRGSTPFFVLVYVEDLVFATADKVSLADVKLELQKRHTCTDLGEVCHYLGLQITKDRATRSITLSQSRMVQQDLQRFKLQHSTVQRTPLAVDHRLTGPFPDEPFERSGPYASFHWTGAVRGAKYLATTSGVGLVLGGRQDVVLTGHFDSSYADDARMHRSTQGYCFSLGSGAVSWRSTRSSSVSTSTAEAEIYAGAIATQEPCWLTFLLTDLGERPSTAPTLFTHNKATILLCRKPRPESRVKHINVRYFLLRELQRRGQARFDFVDSEANIADIFTKALLPCDHQSLVALLLVLGVCGDVVIHPELCFFVTGLSSEYQRRRVMRTADCLEAKAAAGQVTYNPRGCHCHLQMHRKGVPSAARGATTGASASNQQLVDVASSEEGYRGRWSRSPCLPHRASAVTLRHDLRVLFSDKSGPDYKLATSFQVADADRNNCWLMFMASENRQWSRRSPLMLSRAAACLPAGAVLFSAVL